MKRVSELRASWVRVVVMAAAAVALSAGAAQAAPILLETITHDYGTGPGQVSTPSFAGTCDTFNANSITIYDTSGGCQRFYDVFDFSGLAFDSIDRFELTLTYNQHADFLEQWRVRPAYGAASQTQAVSGNSQMPTLPSGPTFVFNSTNANSNNVFDTIVANRQFFLWFSETGLGSHNFNLFSAELKIFGEEPPQNVPDAGSSMLLMGLGFSLVAGASRRLRARRS